MSIYLQCHWNSCSEIGAFKCTCKDQPFIGCLNHIGLHLTSEGNSAHQHTQILLNLTPEENRNIKAAYEKVNLRSQITTLIAERKTKVEKLYQKIQAIEKEYADKIQYLLNMEVQIKRTIKSIEATNALPSVSKSHFACLLAQLKLKSSLTVEHAFHLMTLSEETSKKLSNQLQNSEGTYSMDQGSLNASLVLNSFPIAEYSGHTSAIRSIDFSSDGRYVASSSNDSSIKIWDIHSRRKLLDLLGHQGPVCAIRFLPNGTHLISGGNDFKVMLWDLQKQSCVNYHKEHTNTIRAIAVSNTGNIIASGGMDHNILLWDFSVVRKLEGHSSDVLSLEFTRCGRYIFSASLDETIRVWHIERMSTIAMYHGHTGQINCISLSNDGKYLASASSDKTLKVWDIETTQMKQTVDSSIFSLSCVSYSHDLRTLVSADVKGNIKVWDLANNQLKYVLKKEFQKIYTMKHSPCGQFIASGGVDRVLRIWKIV